MKRHRCICEFFVKEKGFYPDIGQGKKWSEFLIENIDKSSRVKVSYKEKIYVFSVKVSKVSKNRYSLIFFDITNEYLNEMQLKKMAITDGLTGLFNRRFFDELIKAEIESAKKDGKNLWLAILDIDYFKKINDRFGHQVGDNVLKEVAKVIEKSLRNKDTVFRIGGEEFAIIFKELSYESVKKILNRIRERVAKQSFDLIDEKITISIGVAKLSKNDSVKTLYLRADKLLYEAKRSGRDKIIIQKDQNG